MEMKNTLIGLFIVGAFFFGSVFFARAATSVTRDSITWTFDGDYTVGKFVSGDWYVIAPGGMKVTGITPGWDGTENGSMVNPVPGDAHGYTRNASGYTDILNAAASLPISLTSGDQLISTTGKASTSGNRSTINEAAILTVLSSVPPAGSFRPGYCDPEKVMHNTVNLKRSLLAELAPPASTPSMNAVADLFARPWIDHNTGWTGRYLHPANNMPDYGREISTNVGIGALMLHLDYSDTEKQQLLFNYVQLGIDLYSIVKSGDSWGADGGHASGRKWPILFAGLMLGDADMKNIGQKSGDYALTGSYGDPPGDYIHFGEDDQTFYVTPETVNFTNNDPAWNPDDRGGPPKPYTPQMTGMPEWGIRHVYLPGQDNSSWTAIYRTCCTAGSWSGFVLAAHIMNAQAAWNHNALFDYQDRYMAITNGDPDPFGYTVDQESAGWRSTSLFTAEMWNTYRKNYPGCTHTAAQAGIRFLLLR